jgi:16S rRNA (cytidine1402-2'-O)-methyltransferase
MYEKHAYSIMGLHYNLKGNCDICDMKLAASLILIPTPIGDLSATEMLSPWAIQQVLPLRYFIVEELRTIRRFLRSLDPSFPIDDSQFFVLNEHTQSSELLAMLNPALKGNSIGLLTEAGCPGIADPGASIVDLAHKAGIKVLALPGPSSILLAVMGSGLNGQNFRFNGYLPVKEPARTKAIQMLEKESSDKSSQWFIETPYRNDKVFSDILRICKPTTKLCVAANLLSENSIHLTRTVAEWKNKPLTLNRIPAVFGIEASGTAKNL